MTAKTIFLFMTMLGVSHGADSWVACWTASPHGPYPAGNAVAQPDLHAVFPGGGATDQTFRLIVRPDIPGQRIRLRFSNVFGSQPVTFDEVYAGIHATAGSLVPGSNRAVRFRDGKQSITIEPGKVAYSDPVDLSYPAFSKLAVSFHIAGDSGPMTWHAKAMTTSYLSPPHSGAHGREESSQSFPFTTTSWYFLDAVEVMAPEGTKVVAAFGDSITDGTNSTLNGDDRWPDFLSQRAHALYGDRVSIVNAGIGGNRVIGPEVYDKTKPIGGGPSALERLDRDVLSLPGIRTVVWLEGLNDLGSAGASAEAVIDGFRKGVARLHERGIRVIGATITSSLKSTATHGTPQVDDKRKRINEFIRHGGVFDGVADFDAATLDPATGALRPEFKPSSSVGGPGDGLHPNRAGYQAMAGSIDIKGLL
ncbi:MAG TPA: GDSL-type esterase/lipase family protein [Bryobacteraceae bacterium]|nr:GDSL-type esterase/lipase family protein [Bryobacteraceae bacterium]